MPHNIHIVSYDSHGKQLLFHILFTLRTEFLNDV